MWRGVGDREGHAAALGKQFRVPTNVAGHLEETLMVPDAVVGDVPCEVRLVQSLGSDETEPDLQTLYGSRVPLLKSDDRRWSLTPIREAQRRGSDADMGRGAHRGSRGGPKRSRVGNSASRAQPKFSGTTPNPREITADNGLFRIEGVVGL